MSASPGALGLQVGSWHRIVNFVVFQLGWFTCVLGAARHQAWLGTAVVAAIVAIHCVRAFAPAKEAKLILATLALGALWECLTLATGWIVYPTGSLVPGFPPHWILALWALFATTLNSSLAWLKNRLVVASLLGAVGGPVSFWGGAKMGAVALNNPVAALGALAVGWALLTPTLMAIARRYDGVQINHRRSLGRT